MSTLMEWMGWTKKSSGHVHKSSHALAAGRRVSFELTGELVEGVIVFLVSNQKKDALEYVAIAMDFPWNDSPSYEERSLSSKYGIPGAGMQTLSIPTTLLTQYAAFAIEDQTNINPNHCSSETLFYCFNCSRVHKRCELVVPYLPNNDEVYLSNMQLVCIDHFIPLTFETRLPNPDHPAVIEILKNETKFNQNVDLLAQLSDLIVVKALLHAKNWLKLTTSEQKYSYYFDEILPKSTIRLQDISGRCEVDVSIANIDAILFPDINDRMKTYLSWKGTHNSGPKKSSSKSANNYDNDRKYGKRQKTSETITQAREKMCSFGFSEDQMKMISAFSSPEEILCGDVEMLLACALSSSPITDGRANISSDLAVIKSPGFDIGATLVDDCVVLCSVPNTDAHGKTGAYVQVNLYSGMGFRDIAQAICERNLLSVPLDHLKLYYQLQREDSTSINVIPNDSHLIDRSWFVELSYDADAPSSNLTEMHTKSITTLKNYDVISMRLILDNIGPPSKLHLLSRNYGFKASMIKKIQRLEKIYEGWRPIRGDGNCYYRTVIFGLIEQIILTKRVEKFWLLAAKFDSLNDEEIDYLLPSQEGSQQLNMSPLGFSFANVRNSLTMAAEGKKWDTMKEFEDDILDSKTNLDLLLIAACRKLVSKYLIDNKEMIVNDLSLSDAILSGSYLASDMHEYCARYVETMGEDAEGPLVDFGILLKSLDCWGVTIHLDRRDEVPMLVFETPFEYSGHNGLGTIHLLLRPGHYDLLYPWRLDYDSSRPMVSGYMLRAIINDDSEDAGSPMEVPTDQYFQIDDIHKYPRVRLCSLFASLHESPCAILLHNTMEPMKHYERVFMQVDQLSIDDFFRGVELLLGLPKLSVTQYSRHEIMYPCFDDFSHTRPDRYEMAADSSVALHLGFAEDEIIYPQIKYVVTVWVDVASINNRGSFIQYLVTLDLSATANSSFDAVFSNLCRVINIDSSSYYMTTSQDLDLIPLSLENDCLIQLLTHFPILVTSLCAREDNRRSLHVTKLMDIQSLENLIRTDFGIPHGTALNIEDAYSKKSLTFPLTPNTALQFRYCQVVSTAQRFCAHNANAGLLSTTCGHFICSGCVDQHLHSLGKYRPVLRYLDDESTGNNTEGVFSIFQAPNLSIESAREGTSEHLLPQFCTASGEIPCPCSSAPLMTPCSSFLDAAIVCNSGVYNRHLIDLYDETEGFVRSVKSMQRCGLSDIYCGKKYVPLDELMQLGCNHFFHWGCIGDYFKMRLEVIRHDPKINYILCPSCEEEKIGCFCHECQRYVNAINEKEEAIPLKPHIFTESEVYGMRLVPVSTITKEISDIYLDQRAFGAVHGNLEYIKCPVGNCNNVVFLDGERPAVFYCQSCNINTCLLCNKQEHKGKTCAEAARELSNKIAEESGEMMQRCPNCSMLWGLTINCTHATCPIEHAGCGAEFCFLCGTTRSPTTIHSNAYHLPSCDLFSTCCNENCIVNNLPHCIDDKFCPGPCEDCIQAKRNNACEHRPGKWVPCLDCVRHSRNCIHWCRECSRLGKLCGFAPGEPYRLIKHQEALAEGLRLKKP